MEPIMKTLTGAGAIVCAAHRSKDGELHGHTWEVTAWWDDEPNAVQRQNELQNYLKIFDHGVLGDDLAWAEALGKAIVMGLDCCRVDISRPLERLYATVTRN
jgi:hypothetical protein